MNNSVFEQYEIFKKMDPVKIQVMKELAEQMEAPLARGERAGMIAYYMDGEKLGELPVVTAEAVEKAGYIDQLQKLFGKWAGFRNKAA